MRVKYAQLEQAFKDNDIVYINTWSQDCDGVNAVGHREFTSIDEFYKWEEDKAEWADGPFGWDLTTREHVNEEFFWGGWE